MENWIFSTHVTFKGFVALFYCLLAFDVPHEMRKIRSACFFLFSSMHADCNFIQHVKFTTMHICTKLHFDAAPAPAPAAVAAVTTRRAFLFSSSFIFFSSCYRLLLPFIDSWWRCWPLLSNSMHCTLLNFYLLYSLAVRFSSTLFDSVHPFTVLRSRWAKTVCAQIFYLWFVLFGHERAKRESKRDFGLA